MPLFLNRGGLSTPRKMVGTSDHFRIDGADELLMALKELGSEVAGGGVGGQNVVKNALQAAARPLEQKIRVNAPISQRGTWVGKGTERHRGQAGRLRRAIKRRVHPNPTRLNEIVGIGVNLGNSRDDPDGAWYARIVEYKGGRGGRGKGYLRKTMERNRQTSTNIIRRKMATDIEKIGKKIGKANAARVGARVKTL